MAKRKKPRTDLPPGAEGITTTAVESSEPETVQVRIEQRACTIPVAVGLNGYARENVLTRFTGDEATTLKGILQALESAGATLSDGQHVRCQSHALRWIVQQACNKVTL